VIEPTIYNRLVQSAANEQCGGTAGAFTQAFCLACPTCTPGRFFATAAAEGTQLPFCIYMVEASNSDMTLTGSDSLTTYTVTIDCFAKTFIESRAIAIAVNDAFHVWRDNSVNVLLSRLQTSGSVFEEELNLYHYSLTYTLHYRNS
jgi:hypothetical protein